MSRTTTTLVVALLLVVSASAPASAFIGPFADDDPSLDTAQRYGQPSFIVEYENESLPDLREWADASSDRRVVSHSNATNTAAIAGPTVEVTAGFLSRALSIRSLDDLDRLTGDSLLAGASYVESIQPNYVHSLADPVNRLQSVANATRPKQGYFAFDDPRYPLHGVAHMEDANRTLMSESREYLGVENVSETGDGVLVAPIDTGTNVADGTVFGNGTEGSDVRISDASKNFITGETVNDSGYDAIADGNGHGTWVSSSIAANASNDTHDGIAPNAELLVLKALADDGSGSTTAIEQAIRYAADEDADVISLSLGSPIYDDAIVSAIEYAEEQGAIITVAAGNARQIRPATIATPGDAPGVLTVGATNGSAPPTAGSAYFSQYGPEAGTIDASLGDSRGASIDVAAPGMATVAQVPVHGEETQLTESKLSGTSMATPMVAGAAALLVEANPRMEADDARDAIRDYARPVPSAAATEVGNGMAAADLAISEQEPEQDQDDAMTTAAEARDTFHRGLAGDADGIWPFVLRPTVAEVTA